MCIVYILYNYGLARVDSQFGSPAVSEIVENKSVYVIRICFAALCIYEESFLRKKSNY